jgi:hypothetical protein
MSPASRLASLFARAATGAFAFGDFLDWPDIVDDGRQHFGSRFLGFVFLQHFNTPAIRRANIRRRLQMSRFLVLFFGVGGTVDHRVANANLMMDRSDFCPYKNLSYGTYLQISFMPTRIRQL